MIRPELRRQMLFPGILGLFTAAVIVSELWLTPVVAAYYAQEGIVMPAAFTPMLLLGRNLHNPITLALILFCALLGIAVVVRHFASIRATHRAMSPCVYQAAVGLLWALAATYASELLFAPLSAASAAIAR
jgi:type II secretory pathway component PulF